jgi:hypothetical protein
MNRVIEKVKAASHRIDTQHIRLFWFVLSVGLFILGASAPGGDGGGHVGG